MYCAPATKCVQARGRRFAPKRRAYRSGHTVISCSINGGPIPQDASENGKEAIEYFQQQQGEDTSETDFGEGGRFSELPLFPLQVVLNPGALIPLHIFELRYRLLFNRIRDGDSRFGIVLYDKEYDSLARIGCSAELVQFKPFPDGRIMTENIGRERFRIVKILENKPYIRAIVEFVNDLPPVENYSELEMNVWRALQDVLRLSNKLYDKGLDLSPEIKRLAPVSVGEADSASPAAEGQEAGDARSESATSSEEGRKGWPDPRRMQNFSFAVSQVLDVPLRDQQLLLQIRDTGKRLERQSKMLDSARQYLAAQVTIKEAGLGEW